MPGNIPRELVVVGKKVRQKYDECKFSLLPKNKNCQCYLQNLYAKLTRTPRINIAKHHYSGSETLAWVTGPQLNFSLRHLLQKSEDLFIAHQRSASLIQRAVSYFIRLHPSSNKFFFKYLVFFLIVTCLHVPNCMQAGELKS